MPPAPPAPPAPPPGDDEVERRFRALKEGGTAALPPEPSPPAADGVRPEPRAPRPRPGDEGTRRVAGEVIEGPGTGQPYGQGARPARPAGAARAGAGERPPTTVRAISWSVRGIDAGRIGLWIGLSLVLLGGYLVLAPLFPAVKVTGSGTILILGLVGLVASATGRAGSWATYVGAAVAAAGTAGLLTGLGILYGSGWTTLSVGLVLLVLAAWRAVRHAGWRSLAAVGAVVAGLGTIEILGWAVPGFPSLGELLLATVLMGIGWIVLRNSLRPGPPRA